jgi:squalene-associated FAD-dependent desaturase
LSAQDVPREGRHVVVVGGGYAGVAASVALATQGVRVTLLESRRHWGGRATSWPDPKLGDVVDNGQHVFLGCYAETLELLEALGTRKQVRFPASLRLVLREPGGRETRLDAGAAPGKLGLAWALFAWDALPFAERLALARAVAFAPPPDPALTVADWLRRLGQGESARRFFWRPLVEAAINESEERAPAAQLHAVVARAFRGDARAAAIGVARVGLAELVAPIERFLEERGGEARLGVEVRSVARAGQEIEAGWTIELEGEPALHADGVVVAVPAVEARAIVAGGEPAEAARLAPAAALDGSPIVTATLWFDRAVMPSPMIGLVAPPSGPGPGFHWAFDRSAALGGPRDGRHAVTLVASAARPLAACPTGEILERAQAALELYAITTRAPVFGRVVKEPRATPSFTPASHAARPLGMTPRPGLAFAGDWTKNELPATIEGAVTSGRYAAFIAMEGLRTVDRVVRTRGTTPAV